MSLKSNARSNGTRKNGGRASVPAAGANYRTVAVSNISKTLARSQDRKNAIKDLNKEVQSALLPDIQSAVRQQRVRSMELRKPKEKKTRTRIEYLHEEF